MLSLPRFLRGVKCFHALDADANDCACQGKRTRKVTVGEGGTGGEIGGDTMCATLVALNKASALFRVSRSLILIRQEPCRPRGQGDFVFQSPKWKA